MQVFNFIFIYSICTIHTYPHICIDALYCAYTKLYYKYIIIIYIIKYILVGVIVKSVYMVHLLTDSKFFKLLKTNIYLYDQEYCNDKSSHVLLENKPS